MENWSLYRHTSPSGKVYIGITSRSPEVRWGKNGCYYRGQVFVSAIMKYGWDNIKHEVLFTNLSEEKAKHLEIELIRHYKNLGISYNMTDGGDGTVGFHPSEETIAKLKERLKNRDHTKFIAYLNDHREEIGIKHRKAVVQFTLQGEYLATYEGGKFASIASGIDPSPITACCKGKAFSAGNYLWMYETDYISYSNNGQLESVLKEMIKKATTPQGSYERSAEWRQKISERLKGVDRRSEVAKRYMNQRSIEVVSIPILQLDVDNVVINVFRSGSDVREQLGFCNSYISKCCRGEKEIAYGYKWQFITKEEYEEYKRILDAA